MSFVAFQSPPNATASAKLTFTECVMSDLDPEIWKNPTLGEAAHLETLDVRTAQDAENRAAKLEGREPLEVRRIHNYPGAHNDVSIVNSYDDGLRYYDADGNEMPTNWGQVPTDGEPEDPGYDKTEAEENGETTEFTGTDSDAGGNGSTGGTGETVGTDDGYQS